MASARIKHGKIRFVQVNRSGVKTRTQGQGIKLSMFSNPDLLSMAGSSSKKIRAKVRKELLEKRGIDYNAYILEQERLAKEAAETEANLEEVEA